MSNIPPVLVIVFNRADFAAQLFEILQQVKPEKLYVISDGARNREEAIEVDKSREIFKDIPWPCKVKYDYSDKNIGLRKRISSGIDWAFTYEDRLIILEDDCLPHPDFFSFCSSLLDKYLDDERVMTINGCNLNPNLTMDIASSYFFSRYANSWGWATWKRAWSHYDTDLSGMDDEFAQKNFNYNLPYRKRSSLYWRYKLGEVKKSKITSWAFRWMFTLWVQNGLAIVPKNNLIRNIGDDDRSSNTKGNLHFLNISASPLPTEKLSHPKFVMPNMIYDSWLEDSIYSKSIKYRLVWLFKKLTFQI